jgi:hypothetical protein
MKMTSEVPNKALEWANLVLGAGFACAAFMFTELPVAAWNMGIVGALIACCSVVALYRYAAWTEWSNLALGCWAIVAPFLLGFGSAPAPTWTSIVVGVCVASIATLQLVAGRKAGTPSGTGSFAGE